MFSAVMIDAIPLTLFQGPSSPRNSKLLGKKEGMLNRQWVILKIDLND
jgi:hypothetical protein